MMVRCEAYLEHDYDQGIVIANRAVEILEDRVRAPEYRTTYVMTHAKLDAWRQRLGAMKDAKALADCLRLRAEKGYDKETWEEFFFRL